MHISSMFQSHMSHQLHFRHLPRHFLKINKIARRTHFLRRSRLSQLRKWSTTFWIFRRTRAVWWKRCCKMPEESLSVVVCKCDKAVYINWRLSTNWEGVIDCRSIVHESLAGAVRLFALHTWERLQLRCVTRHFMNARCYPVYMGEALARYGIIWSDEDGGHKSKSLVYH